ncbi:MAG: response regulator transcription factor [Bacteroidota bacterium]
MQKIRLIIADDQVLFLKGLRMLIGTFETVELVAEASNGKILLEKIGIYQPDVVLIDLKMPIMDGLEATKKIRAVNKQLKIILLSMYNDESIINHVMKEGANGYLLKNEEPSVLKEAIEAVVQRGFYFNEYVSKALLMGIQQPTKRSGVEISSHLKLTKRELEILQLICKEYTSNEIANQLFLSSRTVEGHRKSLLSKTGVRNTAGLVLFALRNQLIQL